MANKEELFGNEKNKKIFGTPTDKIFCRDYERPASQYVVGNVLSPSPTDAMKIMGWIIWALCPDCAEIEAASIRFSNKGEPSND